MENPSFFTIPPIQLQVETTGRFLMLLEENTTEKKVATRLKKAELNLSSTGDFENPISVADLPKDSDGIFFRELGVALLNNIPQQDQLLALAEPTDASNGVIMEPERVVYALQQLTNDYIQGYFDAVKHFYEKSRGTEVQSNVITPSSTTSTWGLQVTNAINSKYNGKGINVAVLDTGFSINHPDFLGRIPLNQMKSFIQDEEVDDLNGHGTHCIGTALGAKLSTLGMRYGIASEANIYVGKVLSNSGRGTDGSIIDGIEWAIENKCRIISMSLGARVGINQPHSPIFEQVAQRAIKKGTLIIAAAGNDSRRPQFQNPVSHPANCPSILAVAAIDERLRIASFSNSGQVDIAAPGVKIHSAWKAPSWTNKISGTSMATPHVAGILALYAEANPTATPGELWHILIRNAKRLDLPVNDCGAGLVYINI